MKGRDKGMDEAERLSTDSRGELEGGRMTDNPPTL